MSFKNAKKIILNSVIEHWQKKWTYSTTGSHLKNIEPKVHLGNTSKSIKNRAAQVALHQLRIGRSALNGQDPIDKKNVDEKLCSFCNTIEDTEHYFLHCIRYSHLRLKMFMEIESFVIDEKNLTTKITNNLGFLSHNENLSQHTRENILSAITRFIIESKRFF